MVSMDRLEEFKDVELDKVIMLIRSGKLKAGRYSKLIKVKKDYKVNKKELFTDNEPNDK